MNRSDEPRRPRSEFAEEGTDDTLFPEDAAGPAAVGETPATTDEDAAAALVQPYIEKLQRLQAEFENFRRRSQQELREREERTTARIFRHILPVIDDLRLAAKAEESTGAGISEGLRIILDKVSGLLREYSIEEIPAVGEKFDPRWHEALIHQESLALPPGSVLEELEQGYRLRDTLVRPARVIVAKEPPPAED